MSLALGQPQTSTGAKSRLLESKQETSSRLLRLLDPNECRDASHEGYVLGN